MLPLAPKRSPIKWAPIFFTGGLQLPGLSVRHSPSCGAVDKVEIVRLHFDISTALSLSLYRVSQEERTKFREFVPYVKLYRYNPKTPISKVERLRR